MFIKNLDFISPYITLYYNKQNKHSTIFTGIISIITVILSILFGIICSIDFIFHKNPIVFYYKRNINDIGIFPINSSQIFSIIEINTFNDSFTNYTYNKLFSIIGTENISYDFYLNNNENDFSHWIYDKCNYSDYGQHLEIFKSKFDNDNLENKYCVKKYYNHTSKTIIYNNDKNFKYPSIKHGIENINNSNYTIAIKECENNIILNNNKCYSHSFIQQKIEEHYFIFKLYYLESYLEIDDYKNPVRYSIIENKGQYYPKYFDINLINYHPIYINSNIGIFFDKKSHITIVNSIEDNVNFGIDENNMVFNLFIFQMKNNVEIYERTYKKIQDITGAIDGIIEILNFISKSILFIFYNQFQIINDFNSIINSKIENIKNKKESTKNSNNLIQRKLGKLNINKEILLNNYIKDNESIEYLKKFNNKNITLFKLNNNELLIYKKYFFFKNFRLTWFNYLKNRIYYSNSKTNTYIEYLINLREKILDEKKLFSFYIQLKTYKKVFIKDNVSLKKNIVNEKKSMIKHNLSN